MFIAPLFPEKQEMLLVIAVVILNEAEGCVITIPVVAVHPWLSVTTTE
jgi:hypothetical protein